MDRLTIEVHEDDESRSNIYITHYKNVNISLYDMKYPTLERDHIEVYLRGINIDLLFEVDYLLKCKYYYLFKVKKKVHYNQNDLLGPYCEIKLYNSNCMKKNNHHYPEPLMKQLVQDIIYILETQDKK